MYEYHCIINRVVDGDTVDVDIDLGFDTWIHNQRIRLSGIDTPESRTRDAVEKKFGLLAAAFVSDLLKPGDKAILTSERYNPDAGKYGRILGDFSVYDAQTDRWAQLTDILIDNHHAVRYREGDKDTMLTEHLDNRRRLIEKGVVNMTLEEAGV